MYKVIPFEIFKVNASDLCKEILDFAAPSVKFDQSILNKIDDKPQNYGMRSGRLIFQRTFNFLAQPSTQQNVSHSASWLIACKLASELGKVIPESCTRKLERDLKQCATVYAVERFRESNRRLGLITGINLSKYGYA